MGFLFIFVLIGYITMCVVVARLICKTLQSKKAKVVTATAIGLLSISFFLSRLLPDTTPIWLASAIYAVSTTWLLVMLYGSIMIFLIWLGKRLLKVSQKITGPMTLNTYLGILAATIILIIGGHINAVSPKVIPYHVGLNGVKIVAVSDLHMGYAVDADDIEKLANIINEQNADLCIIAGDLFDGDIKPVVEQDLGAALKTIKCPVVAVMGNHEYIGGAPDVDADYIRSLGINMLRDSAMTVGKMTIVGRDDLHSRYLKESKSLDEIIPEGSKNIIVVDHQPARIEESQNAGALLHISGHTHAGQVWPFRFFTEKIFPLDYGKKKYGSTTAIVTSGYGTWGPRVRLASQSEVLVID